MSHYYTSRPDMESDRKEIELNLVGKKLKFITDTGVFSRDRIDFGSMLLIEAVLSDMDSRKKVLDVGCGYGPVGISIAVLKEADVMMVDINERAVALSNENASLNGVSERARAIVSDRLAEVSGVFDVVLTNPPIRTGKENIFGIYEESYNALNEGGSLYIVIQKKQGADSSRKKLEELFGNAKVIAKRSGYQIIKSVKE